MLDTNVLSEVIRTPRGAVYDRVAALSRDRLAISIIVLAELRYGVFKKGSDRLVRNLEAVIQGLDVLTWEPPADVEYARLRVALQTSGKPIGSNDMLIAAHALACGAPLVTANIDEFRRVPGLEVIPWGDAGAG